MEVSISQLKDFLRCPTYAFNRHELRRVLPEPERALTTGALFHKLMEAKMLARLNPADALLSDDQYQEMLAQLSDRARWEWDKYRLWIPVSAFDVPPDWEIMGVEKALRAPLGAVTLVGRPDVIIKWNGKYWDVQWKTYSEDLLELLESIRLGWHEVGYQYLATANNFNPWGGTILGTCKKLPGYFLPKGGKKQIVTDEMRALAFELHYLARSPDTQTSMLKELEMQLDTLARDWHSGLKDFDQCHGAIARRRCPYLDVCHHGGSIDSPAFITVAPRY